MTSYPANLPIDAPDRMNVLFIVYPNIVLLDLVGPLQVFTHSRRNALSEAAYRTYVASRDGGRIETNTIVQIESDPLVNWSEARQKPPIHTLIVIGGDGAGEAARDKAFVEQIRILAKQATRVCSVCSGALVLAAAGLLNDRHAVTHWEDCEQLASQYPAVKVEVDPIFIKDGKVWTSAGITAGIDMALAIVKEDLGKPAAIEMARSLVTPMVRSGGQSQFSAELDRQARDTEGRFSRLHDWLSDNIRRRISVDDMADECGMSSRNFSRRYSDVMGISPAKSLEAIRVDRARDLLATTDKSIKVIASRCGFQDDEGMRRAFLRTVNTSPSEYRKQFRLR
ncbi:GlxA family transcriptional regulator [Denitrobaculum tricleocarpae]|uniref:Helix-turn-helix domain-containing protein n=1 Tax=Denitrobaculum tricleocarpae TaxID=2591009 RepID=A0A545TTL9_9PROT|nr:helix-turn-helix domain-containing protein [Denitrobaculum tricleocarpae]TQV80564.1 helix-turn-helix domain-containing protein [Denitrobaculum tricleocarpae]